MNLRDSLALICGVLLSSVWGCASLQAGDKTHVTVQHDVIIRTPSGQEESVSKGATVEVGQDPVYVESKGRVGVVIIPLEARASKMDLNLRPIEDWSGSILEKRGNSLLTKVLIDINKIQNSMAQGKNEEALALIRKSLQNYPGLTYLRFLEGSCLSLMGQRGQAISVLEEALVEYPDQPEAQKLLEVLKAGKSR